MGISIGAAIWAWRRHRRRKDASPTGMPDGPMISQGGWTTAMPSEKPKHTSELYGNTRSPPPVYTLPMPSTSPPNRASAAELPASPATEMPGSRGLNVTSTEILYRPSRTQLYERNAEMERSATPDSVASITPEAHPREISGRRRGTPVNDVSRGASPLSANTSATLSPNTERFSRDQPSQWHR